MTMSKTTSEYWDMIEFAQWMDYIDDIVGLLQNADQATLDNCYQYIGEVSGMNEDQLRCAVEQLEEIDRDGLYQELTRNL